MIEEIHPLASSLDMMAIYMMSSSTLPHISATIDDSSEKSLRFFPNDEEILKPLIDLEYPWDDMHHRSFFLLEEIVS